MKQKQLFALWGALFILCAILGFIPRPQGFVQFLMCLAALCFFATGGVILYRAGRAEDSFSLRLVRDLSACSLALTAVLLAANFLSVAASPAVGDMVYSILVIVSSPMVCGRYWVASIFLWACLLLAARSMLRRQKKN